MDGWDFYSWDSSSSSSSQKVKLTAGVVLSYPIKKVPMNLHNYKSKGTTKINSKQNNRNSFKWITQKHTIIYHLLDSLVSLQIQCNSQFNYLIGNEESDKVTQVKLRKVDDFGGINQSFHKLLSIYQNPLLVIEQEH